MQPSTAIIPPMEQKACHNCRRRRLRCDRSIPACHKCTRSGQRCLGYGRLYRWVHSDSIGLRGRSQALPAASGPGSLQQPADGKGPHGDGKWNAIRRGSQALNIFPVDPLLQDLSASSRHHLSYFASRLCQDLVVHDNAELGTNPFRELVPMSQAYPALQHIIIAVSAVHYYHVIEDATSAIAGRSHLAQNALVDALTARQDATRELIAFIDHRRADDRHAESQADRAALLATILFFVNFTLIDSGKDGWKNHLTVAGKLLFTDVPPPVSLLLRAEDQEPPGNHHHPPSPMDLSFLSSPTTTQEIPGASCQPLTACDYVASDTVAYSIWSCVLESLLPPSYPSPAHSPDYTPHSLTLDAAEVLRILSRTEDNSYHSCPARLMGILLQTARITQHIKTSGYRSPNTAHMDVYLSLLKEAETFDVNGWAAGVSRHIVGMLGVVNEQELALRRHAAATYRATVCLYILLVAPGLPAEIRRRAQLGHQDTASLPTTLATEDLTATIFRELSFIPKTNPLFKFTLWPVFLMGIDAVSEDHRAWVVERLRAMRDAYPWGIIPSAMEVLARVWKLRDGGAESDTNDAGLPDAEADMRGVGEEGYGWLARIQGLRIDCLIV
ncbi:fungal-specific transcription factor domain-containing protein [Xylaria intraflava]|nr:fungal-specific transcription factor domain-containing protein [Xylaria intraflava]